jgi:hypothetical protein
MAGGARAANGSADAAAGAAARAPAASADPPRRRLRVVTRCATKEEFLIAFAPLADETSIFVLTSVPRPLGIRQPFVIELRDGAPMLRGEAEVVESVSDPAAPARGMRLRLLTVDEQSLGIHRELLARSGIAGLPPPMPPGGATQHPPAGSMRPRQPPRGVFGDAAADSADPTGEMRAKGSEFQLPANPFEELSSDVLEAFVDCTLFDNHGAVGDAAPGAAAESAAGPASVGSRTLAPPGVPLLASLAPGPMQAMPSAGAALPATAGTPSSSGAQGRRWAVLFAVNAVVCVLGTLGFAWWLWGRAPTTVPAPAPAEVAHTTAVPAVTAPEPIAAPPPSVTPVAPNTSRCTATLRSEPRGAAVLWNGMTIGSTPLVNAAVPCGPALVLVERNQYISVEHTVKPQLGRPVFLFDRLKRPPVRLDVTSDPTNAKIVVSGRNAGRSPTSASVGGYDEIEVVATMSGYKPRIIRVQPMPPSTTVHLELDLATARPAKR